MMFPVVLLLERKFLPDGGKSSYYVGVNIQSSFHRWGTGVGEGLP